MAAKPVPTGNRFIAQTFRNRPCPMRRLKAPALGPGMIGMSWMDAIDENVAGTSAAEAADAARIGPAAHGVHDVFMMQLSREATG